MRFRILGHLEVRTPNGWMPINASKWRSLLACLLVRPGQLVPTDLLISELWGDNPPPTANNMVSIYVHRLRKEVIGDADGETLVRRAPGYLLRVAPGDLDSQVFESLVAEGRTALAGGDPGGAAALLAEALGLWRGPLLADVQPSPMLAAQAGQAAERWLEATELRIEADLACGRAAQVVAELRGLVPDHPLRERLWALLMRALEDAGRRAEAFEAYAQARQVISDELGVDPGNELQRLHAELLAADASSTTASAPSAPSAPARTAPRRTPETSAGAGRPGAVGQADDAEAATAADAAGEPGRPARAGLDGGPDGGVSAAPPPAESPGSIAIGTIVDPGPAWAAARPATTAASEAPPQAPSGPPIPRPAQLPADIGDFTGRETPVAQLCALLLGAEATSGPGAVRIAVVNGAGGLGKTTLAVHAAHQVRADFPDGQLYVDLLGASGQPAEPGEVLARFLRDLGVEGGKVPARDDERGALYRTRLAGRRVLILLDNAKDAAQVRPLLPGSSSCTVLVTTRNRTPDLVSTRFVDLNVLEDSEALALFSTIVGEERAAAEPDATAEVLVACAGLPLALRICAARLAARQQWRIATLAGRLRNEQRRLDELSIGDLAVRSSFQVSYDSLRSPSRGVDPARVFRLLGLWQGSRISLAAAAVLISADNDDAEDALETLVDANLLESPTPGWYRFHDLLRVYATERALAEEPEAERDQAVRRLLLWYLRTAEAAADKISPLRYRVAPEPATPDSPRLDFGSVEFDSVDDVLAWCDEERANFAAATRQAAAAGLDDIAWRLPPTISLLFTRRSNYADAATINRVAAASARKAGQRLGEAWALNQLGFALARLRDPEAFAPLEQALEIRQELGDTQGEAQTAIALGEGYLNINGPGEDALRYMRRAVDVLEPTGATSLRSVALNNLGEVLFRLGDEDAAVECYTQARDICREIGGHVEGHALHNLGNVLLRAHRVDEAITSFNEALSKHRAWGVRVGEANTLKHLGEAQAEAGRPAEARASLAAALGIYEQIGDLAEVAATTALLAPLTAG